MSGFKNLEIFNGFSHYSIFCCCLLHVRVYLSATCFHRSESSIRSHILGVNISMISVSTGPGLLLWQEKRSLTWMGPVGLLRDEHVILSSDSLE